VALAWALQRTLRSALELVSATLAAERLADERQFGRLAEELDDGA
jgi:hypothetical protein